MAVSVGIKILRAANVKTASDARIIAQNVERPMTDRRAYNSTLRASTKRLKRTPIARHTRLRNRGGTMFKLSADDKALWKWMGLLTRSERLPCDGCGKVTWLSRAHLLARSRGGRVIDNIALLCGGCHEAQEKRTEQFIAEIGVNLYAKARGHTAQWRKETA